jgi:hypothetical protein
MVSHYELDEYDLEAALFGRRVEEVSILLGGSGFISFFSIFHPSHLFPLSWPK